MELFMTIANGWKPLTSAIKNSISDIAVVLNMSPYLFGPSSRLLVTFLIEKCLSGNIV